MPSHWRSTQDHPQVMAKRIQPELAPVRELEPIAAKSFDQSQPNVVTNQTKEKKNFCQAMLV